MGSTLHPTYFILYIDEYNIDLELTILGSNFLFTREGLIFNRSQYFAFRFLIACPAPIYRLAT